MSDNTNGTRALKGLRVKGAEQPPWGGQGHTSVPGAGYVKRQASSFLPPFFFFFLRAANSFLSDLLHSLQGGRFNIWLRKVAGN